MNVTFYPVKNFPFLVTLLYFHTIYLKFVNFLRFYILFLIFLLTKEVENWRSAFTFSLLIVNYFRYTFVTRKLQLRSLAHNDLNRSFSSKMYDWIVTFLRLYFIVLSIPVSYTHLDVYKRQAQASGCSLKNCLCVGTPGEPTVKV